MPLDVRFTRSKKRFTRFMRFLRRSPRRKLFVAACGYVTQLRTGGQAVVPILPFLPYCIAFMFSSDRRKHSAQNPKVKEPLVRWIRETYTSPSEAPQ